MILSIDIGRRNLGYVIGNKESLTFGLYDIDEGKRGKGILYRTVRIHEFLKEKFDRYPIETVIIEKQVPKNIVAWELMCLFVSAAYIYTKNIVLYNPKRKFTSLSVDYTTKHKAHKKLAIDLVKNYLAKYKPEDYYFFETFTKQDDISDALLMLLTYMYKGNKKELMKIRGVKPNEKEEEKEKDKKFDKLLDEVYYEEEVKKPKKSKLKDIYSDRDYLLGLL